MTALEPLRLGTAFATTVGVGYALCTMVFWLFPEASASFMNALFHGLDFRALRTTDGFTFGSFVLGLVVLVGWSFMLGALFGWIARRVEARA